MEELDKKDVILPAGLMKMYAERPDLFKSGGFSEFMSPIEQSWCKLPKMLILFGDEEVFLAYKTAVEKKIIEENVDCKVYVGHGCHCFSVPGFLLEAKPGREEIYRFLATDQNQAD